MCLPCQGLKKSGTAAARFSKDQKHLPGVDNTLKALENVDSVLGSAPDLVQGALDIGEEETSHRFLVVGALGVAMDADVLKGNTGYTFFAGQVLVEATVFVEKEYTYLALLEMEMAAP